MREVRFMDAYQRAVLSSRYLETLLASGRFIFVQVLQATLLPILVWGAMVAVMQGRIQGDGAIAMSVVGASLLWIGCSSGCGVLIEERVMFVRERRTADLDIAAYLYSKMRGLCVLGVVSVLAYSVVFFYFVFDLIAPGWLVIALLAAMGCGVSLGLLVSSFSRTKKQAYWSGFGIVAGMLGLALVQVWEGDASGLRLLARFVPIGWVTESLLEFEAGGPVAPDYLLAFGYLLPLGGFSLAFLALAYVFLKRQSDGKTRI